MAIQYLDEWEKANVVPVHKKGNKQSLKSYRSILLLLICSKIFEDIMYNEMTKMFITKCLSF